MFKRHNPGCPCSCGDVPPPSCLDQCLYKCDGIAPCPELCGIKITMPEPDSVAQATGPSCPPPGEGCPEAYDCDLCYYLFDGTIVKQFAFGDQPVFARHIPCTPGFTGQAVAWYPTDFDGTNTCDNTTFVWHLKTFVGQDVETAAYDCWESTNADCPECTEAILQCSSLYGLRDIRLELNITYADGCSTTTVTISYVVYKKCDEEFDFNTLTFVSPETRYTHVFERTNQCECDEIFGAMTFVGTTSENNSRGITVPDPCNLDSATIELEGIQTCDVCYCYDCTEENGIAVIDLDGPSFDGTVAVQGGGSSELGYSCSYTGSFDPTDSCVTSSPFKVEVNFFVTCYACGIKELYVELKQDSEVALYKGTINDCTDLPLVLALESYTGDPSTDCKLDEYTVSVL